MDGCPDPPVGASGRGTSWFLLAFGVWSWFIWISFVRNLIRDASGLAFDDAGDPT
ncbi:SCO4848 family membrane protein, partial [Streptomyces alkaliphilus]|uniref:SCO4848 family membrane protein n=1 Tax=Streptomyces alkaliphilus TaxID=1472722 RepID=UPI0034D3393F